MTERCKSCSGASRRPHRAPRQINLHLLTGSQQSKLSPLAPQPQVTREPWRCRVCVCVCVWGGGGGIGERGCLLPPLPTHPTPSPSGSTHSTRGRSKRHWKPISPFTPTPSRHHGRPPFCQLHVGYTSPPPPSPPPTPPRSLLSGRKIEHIALRERETEAGVFKGSAWGEK